LESLKLGFTRRRHVSPRTVESWNEWLSFFERFGETGIHVTELVLEGVSMNDLILDPADTRSEEQYELREAVQYGGPVRSIMIALANNLRIEKLILNHCMVHRETGPSLRAYITMDFVRNVRKLHVKTLDLSHTSFFFDISEDAEMDEERFEQLKQLQGMVFDALKENTNIKNLQVSTVVNIAKFQEYLAMPHVTSVRCVLEPEDEGHVPGLIRAWGGRDRAMLQLVV
jgi:hypothetical protein